MINYCASLTAFLESNIIEYHHLVVLCMADNISTKNKMMHTCKKFIIGQALARFFCSFLIGVDVCVNAKRINTVGMVHAWVG